MNINITHELLMKPRIQQIIKIIKNKEVNISDLKRDLKINYNNTFTYIKKLKEAGVIYLKQTGEQNNPSLIIPLISEDINLKEKSNLEKIYKMKNRIRGVLVTIKKKEKGILWEESKMIYKEMREHIPSKSQYSMKVIKDEGTKGKEIIINFLFEPEKASNIPKTK